MTTGYRLSFCSLAVIAALFPLPAGAQTKADPRKDFIVALTEENIKDFLQEVRAISTGQRPEMMDEDVEDYFANHMADNGEFKSKIQYQIPSFPTQDTVLSLNKEQYTEAVVQGRYMLENYQTDILLEDLKIAGNGRSATFTSTTREKGKMPWLKDPEKKDQIEMIPIEGKSVCTQKLVVSYNNFIQMAHADCDTLISFDPFGDKPLVPQ